MANLSGEFQRRQLPGPVEREDLYPVSLTKAMLIPFPQEKHISSIAEVDDWREGLKDMVDFSHAEDGGA